MFPTIVLTSQVWIVYPCVLPVWRGTQDLRPRAWRVDAPRMERKGTDWCKGWESVGRPKEKDVRNSCASSMETSLSIPTHTDTLSNTVSRSYAPFLSRGAHPARVRMSCHRFVALLLYRKIIFFYSTIIVLCVSNNKISLSLVK